MYDRYFTSPNPQSYPCLCSLSTFIPSLLPFFVCLWFWFARSASSTGISRAVANKRVIIKKMHPPLHFAHLLILLVSVPKLDLCRTLLSLQNVVKMWQHWIHKKNPIKQSVLDASFWKSISVWQNLIGFHLSFLLAAFIHPLILNNEVDFWSVKRIWRIRGTINWQTYSKLSIITGL